MKTFFKLILYTALLVGLILGSIILYSLLTEFKPELATKIETDMPAQAIRFKPVPNKISMLNWNIGYCGLGKDMDFFYDGGKMVRPSKEQNQTYFDGVKAFLKTQKTDFVLLQEVDRFSKRSYKFDQYLNLRKEIPQVCGAFAYNYKVNFVPLPFTNPLGKVNSGLASYSNYRPNENIRYQFPGNFTFPKKLFMLKRCFLFQRFKTQNGKDLIIVNTHNSAYDSGGFLKKKQMNVLKDYLVNEYEKGNYVIVGGDWNQIPADFDNLTFKKSEPEVNQIPLDANYIKDWQWAYDGAVATNRKTKKPYDKNSTFTTVIDFYLVSPNVKVTRVKGINLDFAFSDHQPVYAEFELID